MSEEVTTKKCSCCTKVLPFGSFSKHVSGHGHPFGLRARCKLCESHDSLWQNVNKRAKEEGNPKISEDFKKSLIEKFHNGVVCPVLKIPLQCGGCDNNQKFGGRFNSPTIDAVIHAKGHIDGNLEIISYRINAAKSDGNSKEIFLVASKIKEILEIGTDHLLKEKLPEKDKTLKSHHNVIDGKKWCFICKDMVSIENFSKLTMKGRKYTYQLQCIKCDAWNKLFGGARLRAKEREYDFDLDIEWIRTLAHNTKICPIFGYELKYGGTGLGPSRDSATLDRIDNTKGYTKDNCWIISNRANSIKNSLTHEELFSLSYWLRNEEEERDLFLWKENKV
jgi:hypothetical protein